MKNKLSSLSLTRQHELVFINRLLASLVVILAFSTGLLLALREEWLMKRSPPIVSVETTLATSSGNIAISQPSQTSFSQLLRSARYDRVLDTLSLTQQTLFQLLWSAQGKITAWGERTVPSYKSTYPISLVVFIRRVDQIPSGWYRFNALSQQLEPEATMPLVLSFPDTVPGLLQAPLLIVASVPSSLSGDGLTWNEAGGIAQNILLAATHEQLATFLLPATTLPAAFTDQLKQSEQTLLWLMPVGHRKIQATQNKENS